MKQVDGDIYGCGLNRNGKMGLDSDYIRISTPTLISQKTEKKEIVSIVSLISNTVFLKSKNYSFSNQFFFKFSFFFVEDGTVYIYGIDEGKINQLNKVNIKYISGAGNIFNDLIFFKF